jgi:hypothetical protein
MAVSLPANLSTALENAFAAKQAAEAAGAQLKTLQEKNAALLAQLDQAGAEHDAKAAELAQRKADVQALIEQVLTEGAALEEGSPALPVGRARR